MTEGEIDPEVLELVKLKKKLLQIQLTLEDPPAIVIAPEGGTTTERLAVTKSFGRLPESYPQEPQPAGKRNPDAK
jgi:hypothetical protein